MKLTLYRLLAFVLLPLLLQGALPVHAEGEDLNVEGCREQVVSALSSVHDEYRSVLFGSREDADGKYISNTGGEVDEERIGIFERRYRDTSELIWPLVESYRVMRCRSLYVCRLMELSLTKREEENDELNLHLLGCAARTAEPMDLCSFGDAGSLPDANVLTTECKQLVEDSLTMEQAVLRLAVAYDSSYRGTLQFVGMADWMMKDFPKRAFLPLRAMVNMLGKLYQIPCFSGQCDLPDTSDIQLPGPSGFDPNSGDDATLD